MSFSAFRTPFEITTRRNKSRFFFHQLNFIIATYTFNKLWMLLKKSFYTAAFALFLLFLFCFFCSEYCSSLLLVSCFSISVAVLSGLTQMFVFSICLINYSKFHLMPFIYSAFVKQFNTWSDNKKENIFLQLAITTSA